MDLYTGHYVSKNGTYQDMMNTHKQNDLIDIDVDPFEEEESDHEQNENEAKILQTKGRIFVEENACVDSVEICQRTVNPNLKVSAEDFKILKTIGKGGYGTVFLVQKLKTPQYHELFAMKVLKKAKIFCSEKDTAHTVSERNILERLRHPFLVKLYYAFQSQSYLYIVLEYCPGGELFNYLEKIVYLKEDAACFYVAEIALAIGHLHSLGIIYRDLKSENILLDKDGHVKLTDFGLSKEGAGVTSTFCGTIEYMAPEIIRCQGHGQEVDWWSLGTLLYDMLSGGPPFFQDSSRTETAQSILHSDVKYPESFSPEVISLIKGLLTRDPKKRLGSENDVEDIKKHEFFVTKNKINWDDVYQRKLIPPFKPILESATDVSMFDKNFTSMNPAVSPADPKTTVPSDVFQGFSYVANSVCDTNLLRDRDDVYSSSLRSDRRKLLINSRLSGIQGFENVSASPRLTRIAQEPSDSYDASMNGEESSKGSVEPAADCLLMDVDLQPNGRVGPTESTSSATRHIPIASANSKHIRMSPPKSSGASSSHPTRQSSSSVNGKMHPVSRETGPVSSNGHCSKGAPSQSAHVNGNGAQKQSANGNCCLM